ncbi:MAG: alkaline phosphatase family protein [Candidatus Binatia bacterium]|nr:alkaline phosphatase family protein [Candidatus Binatia bacterium]
MKDVSHGQVWRPERQGGQGLDPQQYESAERALLALLDDPEVRDHVDLVLTCRDSTYEVWSRRGLLRFQRLCCDGEQAFRVVELIGDNPIARTDADLVSTVEEERAAAVRSGYDGSDPNLAFIEPEHLSYPFALERIAQLFDSPYTGDLVISPKCYAFGTQLGQHGALDVVQSRAPLAFAGPAVRPGNYPLAVRHVDIAPTICHIMGFPLIDGRDWSGRRASERGVAPDVYLERQDGRVITEIIAEGQRRPQRVYLIVFDGLSHPELVYLWQTSDPAIRNLRRVLDRSAWFSFGSVVNFPSITWPSHSTILTGAWCGHHDIVNPTYYDRARREPLAPQAQGMLTEGFLGTGVETLYEAFRRVYGAEALTVSIHEPQSRGAQHAALEQRVLGARDRLRSYTAEFLQHIDPRYQADGKDSVHREAILDARGLAQILTLLDDPSLPPPVFVAHEFALTDGAGHEYGPHGEGLRAAIAETDRRLGLVLDALQRNGLIESTLFVFTADHGMAPQRVELRANAARHPERIGMRTITGEPMIWLRDLAVRVERAADGRTARVFVLDNDADLSGEQPPVEGAEVRVIAGADRLIAQLRTNAAGVAGFAIPADRTADEIALSIRHPEYNPRHLLLNGRPLLPSARERLFGARA